MITADSVFMNGIVVTVDQKNSFKKAIAVKDGKIIDVGENEDIKIYIGSETKVIDLGGRMILPAAHDAHCHGVSMGGNSLMVNFSYPEVNTIGKVR
ncbi:MAG TPA: amidohydrolase, partial [Ruminococcaceae bacterium]|nr:amidohydrolase [Oscillospiraceae bacterium]